MNPYITAGIVLALAAALASNAAPSAYAQTDDTLVMMETEQGTIVIEFFEQDAPGHVENFVTLARNGFYDDTVFHRIIPGFMIQGGDPNTKPTSGASTDAWGTGGPGYSIDAEFNDIMHNRGIVSMARSMDPNSAGSQFFIVHQDSNFLDADYTVFGRLATQESHDVLDRIAAIQTGLNDRPGDPDRVRITSVEVLTRQQAPAFDLLLLDQGPPERVGSDSLTFDPLPTDMDPNYTNEELNISITFPTGWLVQELDGEDLPDVAAVAPMASALPPSISVFVDTVPDITLEQAIEDKIEDLQFIIEARDFEIVSQETVQINGRDMFVLTAQEITDSFSDISLIQYREVTTISGDNVYAFLFVAGADEFNANLPAFEGTVSTFNVLVEPESAAPPESPPRGGGCLIATAAFGSEMAPQVQQLRELRDDSLAGTASGQAFLDWFHSVYYAFSPAIADYQRENPAFRDTVRLAVTPVISILSLLHHADMSTEEGALLYGMGAIFLIILAYLGVPLIPIYYILRRRVAIRKTITKSHPLR